MSNLKVCFLSSHRTPIPDKKVYEIKNGHLFKKINTKNYLALMQTKSSFKFAVNGRKIKQDDNEFLEPIYFTQKKERRRSNSLEEVSHSCTQIIL